MGDDHIPVNLPFSPGNMPVCACDMGDKPKPTKQQRLECRMRGGPCSPHYNEPSIPTPPPSSERAEE